MKTNTTFLHPSNSTHTWLRVKIPLRFRKSEKRGNKESSSELWTGRHAWRGKGNLEGIAVSPSSDWLCFGGRHSRGAADLWGFGESAATGEKTPSSHTCECVCDSLSPIRPFHYGGPLLYFLYLISAAG